MVLSVCTMFVGTYYYCTGSYYYCTVLYHGTRNIICHADHLWIVYDVFMTSSAEQQMAVQQGPRSGCTPYHGILALEACHLAFLHLILIVRCLHQHHFGEKILSSYSWLALCMHQEMHLDYCES